MVVVIFGGFLGESRRQFILDVGPALGDAGAERAETVVITRRFDGTGEPRCAAAAAAPAAAASTRPASVVDGVKLGFIFRVFIVLFALFELGDVLYVVRHHRHQIYLAVDLPQTHRLRHLL